MVRSMVRCEEARLETPPVFTGGCTASVSSTTEPVDVMHAADPPQSKSYIYCLLFLRCSFLTCMSEGWKPRQQDRPCSLSPSHPAEPVQIVCAQPAPPTAVLHHPPEMGVWTPAAQDGHQKRRCHGSTNQKMNIKLT